MLRINSRLETKEFSYDLPAELIAQEPLTPRDSSRLLVLGRHSGEIGDSTFLRFTDYLQAGDLLVLNNTRVYPARLPGRRKKSGGKVELLLLRRMEEAVWEVLCSPGRRALPGEILEFGDGLLEAEVLEKTAAGGRTVLFNSTAGSPEILLSRLGQTPLPPYIKKKLDDAERYQTVYAAREGSAAAPTAGLHFTPSVFERLQARGIKWVFLTLHIGVGTFRPVKEKYIEQHIMHSEHYELSSAAAEKINRTREKGKRIVAVGTTCCRVLETLSFGDEGDRLRVREGSGETNLFIYPGYDFKIVDALLTNFHLPCSTLLMLVCAFAGKENTLKAYRKAVEKRYRFYSFGDAMLII
ncbi:MAG: tRNA preQ1(34) S-adenosylmethionine ribosyltransferase-isomerase QueA [Firmicutes bacterium]|nr:tRNA preQ1(34) S-adenosylmethionine ribosyltransferase-isomerase QueA [Bacillota bacterium]